jgi:hypothetical protein
MSPRTARALLLSACLATGVRVEAQTVPDPPPLSVEGKWAFGAKETFNPLALLAVTASATFREDRDQFPAYALNTRGFGGRYGTAFGDHLVSDMMTGSVFPILFHEDPRYIRRREGGLFRRFGYALGRIAVIRTDAGSDRFNSSEFVGNATAAGIANFYLPVGDRTPSYAARKFGTFVVSDALSNVWYEFWPDVHHALFRWTERSTAQSAKRDP